MEKIRCGIFFKKNVNIEVVDRGGIRRRDLLISDEALWQTARYLLLGKVVKVIK